MKHIPSWNKRKGAFSPATGSINVCIAPRNATFFRHFLVHFPYILANEVRNPTKKRDGKGKKSSLRCYAILCERTDSLRALDGVAGYLENSHFHLINDTDVGDALHQPESEALLTRGMETIQKTMQFLSGWSMSGEVQIEE